MTAGRSNLSGNPAVASACLALLLITLPALAQAPAARRPDTVDKICGKFAQDVGKTKEKKGETVPKTRNLPRTKLELFRADDSGQCCDGLTRIGGTRTGMTSEFEFKEQLEPGMYWLAFHPGDHNFTILIKYDPNKKPADTKCSGITYVLEDNGYVWISRPGDTE
jgi:hypothetical protein